MEQFFHWVGATIGGTIRAVVEAFGWVFDQLFGAMDSFVAGLTESLGIDPSLFGLLFLLLGVALLYAGIRALLRRAWFTAALWLALGLLLLSWLIN